MHVNTLRMSPPAPRPSASPPGKQPGCRRQQRCPQAGPAAAAAAQEQRPAATSQAHAGHGFRQAAVQVLRRSTQSRVWRQAGGQAGSGTRRTLVVPSFKLSCAFCPLTSTSRSPTSRSARTAERAVKRGQRHRNVQSGTKQYARKLPRRQLQRAWHAPGSARLKLGCC